MGLIVASLGKRAGWEVLVRTDAETAWDILPRRRPDLVLLDVNWPGASGPDWLRRVRAAPEFAGLSVALYTHWGLAPDVVAGLDAGADFVFDKDLAARPADWQKRLMEIREPLPRRERPPNVIDDWSAATPSSIMQDSSGRPPLAGERVAGFNHALRHTFLRYAPPEVLRVALCQALTRSLAPRILPCDLESWLATDGCGLEPMRLPPTLNPDLLLRLSADLLETMGRLLGTDANAALRDALTAAVLGLPEYLAGS